MPNLIPIVMIAAGIAGALSFWWAQKTWQTRYDERQKSIQARAAVHGFSALVVGNLLVLALVMGNAVSPKVGICFALFAAMAVFAGECVLRNAYVAVNRRKLPLAVFTAFGAVWEYHNAWNTSRQVEVLGEELTRDYLLMEVGGGVLCTVLFVTLMARIVLDRREKGDE